MLSLLFCLNRKCALGESVRSEQSSGAGEFAVFGGVVSGEVGVWERVTRSAVEASGVGCCDFLSFVWKVAEKCKKINIYLLYLCVEFVALFE